MSPQQSTASPVPPETPDELFEHTLTYLTDNQVAKPGRYWGAIWSEKAYHGPALDYHAGGSHHHRGAGSAGWTFWQIGRVRQDARLQQSAQSAFDWLVSRQTPRGGFEEIQNNDRPSDWEHTGLSECSTISTAFVARGLGHALLHGLAPKAIYENCLQKIAQWQLSIEWPAGSGVFPHHERSPCDTLNANLHAAETFYVTYMALKQVFGRTLNLYLQAAKRAVEHTLTLQWDDGSFPYRSTHGVSLNYSAVVAWCMLNIRDLGLATDATAEQLIHADAQRALLKTGEFLIEGIDPLTGQLRWDLYETSSAKHNTWTYAICLDVLLRLNTQPARAAAALLWAHLKTLITPSGLLPMRDTGEAITHCAFMQADIFNFLWPHRDDLHAFNALHQ